LHGLVPSLLLVARFQLDVTFKNVLGGVFATNLFHCINVREQSLHIAVAKILALQSLVWEDTIPYIAEVLRLNLPCSTSPKDFDHLKCEALRHWLRQIETRQVLSAIQQLSTIFLELSRILGLHQHPVPSSNQIQAWNVQKQVLELFVASFFVSKRFTIVPELEEIVDLRHQKLTVLKNVVFEALEED